MSQAIRTCAPVCALALMVGVPSLAAQSFQGGLRGAVKDAGGVIPNVTVTMTNEDTAVSRETMSNDAGEYVFVAVPPGSYAVKAVLGGYKTFESKGISIGTQQFITLDLVMEVGEVAEEITVTAQRPLIETSNASQGSVLARVLFETL